MNLSLQAISIISEILLFVMWGRSLAVMLAMSIYGIHHKYRPNFDIHGTYPDTDVVIPAYNERHSIERSLESLVGAEDVRMSIIVVDDGSTDCTAEIASKFLSTRADGSVLRQNQNRGKAVSLNIGLSKAKSMFVLTLDADTEISKRSLLAALSAMEQNKAAAVSFWIDVPRAGSLLARLQHQEYLLGYNMDRAAQSQFRAISVMPGAATLFRVASLNNVRFSGRTATEDADLTLTLASQGRRLYLEPSARACTTPPQNLRALLRQRTRWTAGHIQCAALHSKAPGTRHFRLLTYPNFVLSTLTPILSTLVPIFILTSGATAFIRIDFSHAVAGSLLLVYVQRGTAYLVAPEKSGINIYTFLLEPIAMGVVNLLASLLALGQLSLRKNRLASKPNWMRS